MKEGSTAIFSPEEKKMTDKLFGYPSDYEKSRGKYLILHLIRFRITENTGQNTISEKKSRVLTEKLTALASKNQALMLKRNISLADRVKAGNEQIYYITDALNEAINTGKKVRFLYFEFTAGKRKKLKNDGEPYILSPYTLTWNGDNYYVVGWSDKHEKIATFRVDRFYQVPEILPDDAIPKPKNSQSENLQKKRFSSLTVNTQMWSCCVKTV